MGVEFFCLHFAKAAINCARRDSLFGLARLSKVGQPVIGYPTSREPSGVFLHLNRHSDRRNIRTAEGWHFRLPAARSLPRSTLLSRKSLSKQECVERERKEHRRGVEESHFHQTGF